MSSQRIAFFLQRLWFSLLLAGLFVTPAEAATPMVSAGFRHAMALKSDGSLWAWGWNAFGQLGDGSSTDRATPVKIGEGFVFVSAGMSYNSGGGVPLAGHTVAIKADGSLWAWGDNRCGQLGDGTTTNRQSPVKIGDGFASASAGDCHTIAIKTDGTLWSWGSNENGQLGDGSTTDSSRPIEIGAGYVQVATDLGYSTALGGGSIWSWGSNTDGRLGDGTTANRYSPVNIGDDYALVSVRNARGVALKNDGSLWAWGNNDYGELGDGTTTYRNTPTHVGEGYAHVVAGVRHTLALKGDGSLWAWGKNNYGQLGDGTTNDSSTPVRIGEGYSQVVGGYRFTVAVKDDGTVWTWGESANGQLGDGSTADRHSPGQIDLNLTEDSTPPATEPRIAASKGCSFSFGGVADGSSYFVKADGSLWAWGSNNSGQLGNGGNEDSITPVLIDSDFVQVTAADCHVLAIKSDGSLWAWGYNQDGQLGDGSTTNRKSPVLIGEGYAQVSTSETHTVAVMRDGTLWTWGRNAEGQLGDGSTTNRKSPVLIGTDYRRAKAVEGFTLAVKRTGSLWGWGTGASPDTPLRQTPAMLGTGFGFADTDFANRLTPLRKSDGWWWTMRDLFRLSADPSYVQWVGTSSFALRLDNAGALYSAGSSNAYGQLGNGTTTASNYAVIGNSFAEIAAGKYHSLAIKTDGSLWAWGRNLGGEVGDGTTTNRLSPVQVFPATASLVALSISGPETVYVGGTAEFTASAAFSDNSSLQVKPEWSVTGSGASIVPASLFNSSGAALLKAGEAPVGTELQVTASYIYLGTTYTASVTVKVEEATAVARAACLFAWAERNNAEILAPAGATTQSLTPYTYRYYSGSQAYLGISSADDHLYYLGPLSGNAILDLGSTAIWLDRAGCQ